MSPTTASRRGDQDVPSRFHEPLGFLQGFDALSTARQMIQRAHQQHGIHRRIRQVQLAGVADRGVDGPVAVWSQRFSELFDVKSHNIPVGQLISLRGQPQRIPAGSAADVGDACRGGRQVTGQHLAGAPVFNHALGPVKPDGFVALAVIPVKLVQVFFVEGFPSR